VPAKALKAAFMAGSVILGFNLMDIAEDYRDTSIGDKDIQALVEHGVIKYNEERQYGALYSNNETVIEEHGTWPSAFASLWLEIAKLGMPSLEYKPCGVDTDLCIGGYGLFC
jgi:hypothetical protein